jgi:hypothetical protein
VSWLELLSAGLGWLQLVLAGLGWLELAWAGTWLGWSYTNNKGYIKETKNEPFHIERET